MRVTKLHNVIFISIIGVFNFILCENNSASMSMSRGIIECNKNKNENCDNDLMKTTNFYRYTIKKVKRRIKWKYFESCYIKCMY